MVDPVRLFLLINYYYGRLMGVINFEIDVATGRAKVSRKATFYAALINILIFSVMPLLARGQLWNLFWKDGKNAFHQNVFLILNVLRITCVLLIMLSRWWSRHQIVRLIGQFRRLILKQPQVMKLWRRGVISKFTTGVLTEVIHMIVTLKGLQDILNLDLIVSVVGFQLLLALLNIILSQYYFVLLHVHAEYVLFNGELRSILAETESLERDHRMGVRNLRSCVLADRLDNLAHLQSELQTLIHRMTRVFGIQSLCIGVISYMTIVAANYYIFVFNRHDTAAVPLLRRDNLLLIFGIFFHMADSHITFSIAYYLLDQHAALRHLIVQNTSFPPDLDLRLQKAPVSISRSFFSSFNAIVLVDFVL
ncbi:hypothetical protein ACLKA6_006583 [Drosophila palustris]